MGMVALSLAIARVPLRWGLIFLGGLVISSISYIIRALPLTFGFHLPVVMFLLFVLIIRFTTTPPSRSIIAVFSSLVILALLEYGISNTFFTVSGINAQEVIANEGLWAAIGVIQAVILNIIALAIARLMKPSDKAWKNELPWNK